MNGKPLIQSVLFGAIVALTGMVQAADGDGGLLRTQAQVRDQTRNMNPADRDAYFDSLRSRSRDMSEGERRATDSGYGGGSAARGEQPKYQYRNQHRNEYNYGNYGEGFESRQGGASGGGSRSSGGGGGPRR